MMNGRLEALPFDSPALSQIKHSPPTLRADKRAIERQGHVPLQTGGFAGDTDNIIIHQSTAPYSLKPATGRIFSMSKVKMSVLLNCL